MNLKYRFSKEFFSILKQMRDNRLDSKPFKNLNQHINRYNSRILFSYFLGSTFSRDLLYFLNSKRFLTHEKMINKILPFYKMDFTKFQSYSFEDRINLFSSYRVNSEIDLSIFKVSSFEDRIFHDEIFVSLLAELRDLVFPYIIDNSMVYNLSNIGEGTYETNHVFVSENDIVIDAGANFGIFSLYAASKKANVFSFEPVDITRNYFLENLKVNPALSSKIKLIPKALGSSNEFTKICVANNNLGASFIPYDSLIKLETMENDLQSVEIITLDEFVKNNSLTQVDFIKADIEGFERELLLGAKNTIFNFHPKISICTYHRLDDPIVLTKIIKEIYSGYIFEYYSQKLYAYVPK